MLMTLALAHLFTAATPSSLHLLTDAPAATRVRLAQAPAALGAAELERQIDELNARIRAINTDWPLINIIGAYLGFSAAAALPIGLIIVLVGLVATSASAMAGGILIVGIAITLVGLAGLIIGILSVLSGNAAQTAVKEERAQLISEREGLERQLKALRQAPPGGVERLPAPAPRLFTLAAF